MIYTTRCSARSMKSSGRSSVLNSSNPRYKSRSNSTRVEGVSGVVSVDKSTAPESATPGLLLRDHRRLVNDRWRLAGLKCVMCESADPWGLRRHLEQPGG